MPLKQMKGVEGVGRRTTVLLDDLKSRIYFKLKDTAEDRNKGGNYSLSHEHWEKNTSYL